MSLSLLLALLEAHEDYEADRSRDYYAWIGAEWDGAKWVIPREPEGRAREAHARVELIMRELYDILQATIQSAISEPEKNAGILGTVLARTLTDDPTPVPPEAIQWLRVLLKPTLHTRFDALLRRHLPLKPLGAQPLPPLGTQIA